ncbi:MAG: NAD-dependent deacylase [Rhodothermales bacterium]
MPEAFSDRLAERLAGARSVAVLTGAGISAESGIPTFRDPGGLWDKFKPEELANVNAFLRNPELVQKWYEHRRRVARETEPNPGHLALVDLESMVPDFTLITQNVDDLHRRAGSRNLIELHGNITRSYCIDCEREADLDTLVGGPVRCPACGGLVRPDVVWFGEMLPEIAVEQAVADAVRAEVFLSVGTSALVDPAAGLPLEARSAGAYVAEVNVERSAIAEELDEVIIGKSGEILPRLVATLRQRAGA